MKIISQDYLPVRTFILIGMVLLTTTTDVRPKYKYTSFVYTEKCHSQRIRQID